MGFMLFLEKTEATAQNNSDNKENWIQIKIE